MNYAENRAWTELQKWIEKQGFTVFGTLKFTDGLMAGDVRAEKIVCAYFNALDRAYFGNAVDNVGMRHKRLVFKHLGTSGTNLHYHFLAKPSTDASLFSKLARQQWAKMSSWTIGADDTKIGPVCSNKAASSYVLHEYAKLGADCICLPASSLNSPARNPLSYRNLAQLRRLLSLQEYVAAKFVGSEDEDNALCWT
ncbi:hypothetical protein [Ruegeria arenilitoris]|uniref:hypothetical protein n=1 Tax=Ruegeria arenilitoris TaxID=1173585 RepID=UPI0014812594|nr:hypothetical protein [Ruegeria arenilitoris]